MKELLEPASTSPPVRRWTPKMRSTFSASATHQHHRSAEDAQKLFREAISYVTGLASEDRGRTFLFVGTKRQAQDAIREEGHARRPYYINSRWLGGCSPLPDRQEVDQAFARPRSDAHRRPLRMMTRRSASSSTRSASLGENLSGIKNMNRLPDALSSSREEGRDRRRRSHRLGIPVIAVVAPTARRRHRLRHPRNDDALRAVRLFARASPTR